MQTFVEIAPGVAAGRVLESSEGERIVRTATAIRSWRAASIKDAHAETVDQAIRFASLLHESDAPSLLLPLRERLQSTVIPFLGAAKRNLTNSPIQLVKYTPGGYYRPHRDNGQGSKHRCLTILCYLNDNFDGGSTVFPKLDVSIRPSAGSVVLFNPSLLHSADPVLNGEKLIALFWLLGMPHESRTGV